MINKLQDDTLCIEAWRERIGIFNNIVKENPKPETIRKELEALKVSAKINPHLTMRQIEGITARCDNYLNGTYGNTKTDENMNQQPQIKK